MTREEAIAMLKSKMDGSVDTSYEWAETIRMAIEELQDRSQGEWIDYTDDGYVECPFCHNATNCDDNKEELHFCFSCGADMRGKNNAT